MKLPWRTLLLLLVAMWIPLTLVHRSVENQRQLEASQAPSETPAAEEQSYSSAARLRTVFSLPVTEASLLANALTQRGNSLLWLTQSRRIEAVAHVAVELIQWVSCDVGGRFRWEMKRVESSVVSTRSKIEPVIPQATTTPLPRPDMAPIKAGAIPLDAPLLRVAPVRSAVDGSFPAPVNRPFRIRRRLQGRFWRL